MKHDERMIGAYVREHGRQVERRCRRVYGARQWSKAEILVVVEQLMLHNLQRLTAQISYLGDRAGEAARSIEALGKVMRAIKPTKPKGKRRNGTR